MRLTKLGEICNVSSAGDKPTDFTEIKTTEHTIPVIANGIEDEGVIGYTSKPKISRNTVTISARGNIGTAFYRDYPYYPVIRLISVYPKNDSEIDCQYLYYLLKNSPLKSIGSSVQAQLTVPIASDVDLFIEEDYKNQQLIAAFLGSIDEKISINDKIIETSEKLMREIYDYWFVQFDFPDENGRPYKSSGGEMVYDETLKREIPKGWKPSSISDVVSLNARGITQKEPTKGSEKIAVVNQKCIRDGNIDSRELYWHNSDVKFKECLRLEFMDTLVNSMGVGTLGRISPFILNMEAVPHSCVSLLRYKDGVSTKCWLYSQVKSLEPYITSIGVGSTGQQSLTNKDLGGIKIAVPPIHLMTTFDEVADPVMRSIMNLNEENAKLISLRDWLLPMLMNGQIVVDE